MLQLSEAIEAYESCCRHKARSEDTIAFEIHKERNLVNLCKDVNNKTFQSSAYTFIASRPKPREVFACEMAMRVNHHYIDDRLRPLIEAELTKVTYNNRKGFGQLACIDHVISDIYEVSRGFTRDAWIISLDLQGYFPNANQDIVYDQLRDLVERKYTEVDKDTLLYLIQRSIFSYPARHCYRKSPIWMWQDYPKHKSLFYKEDGIGGAIGHLIWQNAMNYYLNEYDHWLLDECGLHYTRYVDDQYFVTDNKECLLAMIPEMRRRLAVVGCRLNPKKMYCQHISKGAKVLGYVVKLDRLYIGNRVVRNAFNRVHQLNQRVSQSRIETFIASMNSYCGILKGCNGYAILRNLIDQVSPKWWKYVHFNPKRLIIEANEGYTHREMLIRKYHIKLRKDGNKRKNYKNRRAPAGVNAGADKV